MAEIDDHGQSLTLRTRRGADFVFELALTDTDDNPIDMTGAVLVSRIFAAGQPQLEFAYVVGGVDDNIFTATLTAAQTLNMSQDWNYVIGYRLAGVTQPLLFGPLFVSQEQL